MSRFSVQRGAAGPPDSVETVDLRRCVRDLVALSALPAVWVGYRPLKMAESLAEALLTMLQLDFVFIQLAIPGDPGPQRVLRLPECPDSHELTDRFAEALTPLLLSDDSAPTLEIESPVNNAMLRSTVAHLGRAKHGLLIGGSRRANFPTSSERLLLGVGANQAAILLERQQLQGETQKARAAAELHATQLKSVAMASVAIASSTTLSDALRAVTESARHIIGAHASVISLGRTAGEEQVIRSISASDKYARHHDLDVLPDRAGVFSKLCRDNRSVRTIRADRGSARLPAGDGLEDAFVPGGGLLAVPLVGYDGRNIGLLAACDKYDGDFTGEDESILTQIAQVAVAAVERERLLESEREARSEAEALMNAGKQLSSELDLHRLVQVATDASTELTGAEFGAFFYNVVDAKGESYTLYTISGVPRERFAQFPMPRNTEIFGPTFRGEGIVRLNDVTKDPRYGRNTPYHGMPPGHLPVRSYLAVPVTSRAGEVLGGLFFGHSQPGRFQDRHERIVAGIASEAAIAIDNARLYEAVRASKVEAEQSLSQLQAVVGSMTDGLVIADARGSIRTMNAAALAIHGFSSAEEMLGKLTDYRDLFELRDTAGMVLPLAVWPISRVLQGERFSDYEVEVRRRDTGNTWIGSYGGMPVLDSDGKLFLAVLTLRDVTEQKRTQAALAESEAKFRQLADTIPQLAWMAKADGWIFWYNRRWYEYSGTTPEQMEGWGWQRIHDPAELPRVMEGWQRSIATGEPFEMEFPLKSATGEFRWFLTRVAPFRDGQGKIILWFGTNTDIEDQRRVGEQRAQLLESERAARSEVERASRMKDEFLSTLSHELRTPLNAILGWSQILRTSDRMDDLREGLATIERNARNQAQIIEDLLDMSRIISGKVRLDVQRIDLIAVIEAAIQTARPAAEAKEIRIVPVLDPRAAPVSGDPNRLQQVFWNLLSNAVKFTSRGGRIQVLLERVNSHVEVSVIDSGEGIKPEFLPHVFDRFRQADASTTRRHGGLGLGLAIVKQLIELHGGTARAKSAGPGHGSTFVVTLPLTVVHPDPLNDIERRHPSACVQAPDVDTRLSLKGVRVLVVDDEPDARGLVQRLLTDCDANVTTAGSAAEAMSRLEEGGFDVLVSDIGMPLEDGYALMRRVRRIKSPIAHIPALALTAYARSEDRQRAILAGYQLHVAKPVEPSELITMVASLAERTQT